MSYEQRVVFAILAGLLVAFVWGFWRHDLVALVGLLAATAVIMAPVAFGLATQLGVNPDAFLMGVAVGASCAFLTPIGHQNNMLVMGPGGYRFGDYWRMGLPLEILIVAVATPLTLWVWPL